MNLTLHPDDEKLIQQRVESGQYSDPSAVISEALRALRERERHYKEIRNLLDERWEEANDPNATWVDGEEAIARQEKRIAEYESGATLDEALPSDR